MRSGVIAQKVGMTRVFTEAGEHIPVTVLKLGNCQVVGHRTTEKNGYVALQLGSGSRKSVYLPKAERGQFELDLPQYHEHFFSAVKKGYSGTAIFSKLPALRYLDGFPEDIVEQFGVTGDTYGDPNKEGRVIAAEFDAFWVVTVYTPNSKGDLTRLELREKHWDPAFLAYVTRLEETKPVLFCGDLNVAHQEIDLANPKPNMKNFILNKVTFSISSCKMFTRFKWDNL